MLGYQGGSRYLNDVIILVCGTREGFERSDNKATCHAR